MIDRREPLLSLKGLKVCEERSENDAFENEGGDSQHGKHLMVDESMNREGHRQPRYKSMQNKYDQSLDDRNNANESRLTSQKHDQSSMQMYSFVDKSYQEDPENIPSSDSDSDYGEMDPIKKAKLRQSKTYCGIEVKRDFGFLQFLIIPFLAGSIMMMVAYMNAQFAYMLPDKNYFDVPASEIGMQVSNLTIYSMPFSLLTTLFTSYLFELFGRNLTISLGYFLTGIIYIMIPYTKPQIWLLTVLRCLLGVTMAGPVAHPLINDYIRKNSRGKAVALNGLGGVFGEVIAMGVLLELSKNMTYENAFALTGSVILCFGAYFWFFVKNPNMQNIHKRVDQKNEQKRNSKVYKARDDTDYIKLSDSGSVLTFQELTMFQKVRELTDIMQTQLNKRPILYIVIMGASITRLLSVLFSTYLVLWINKNIIVDGTMSSDESKKQQSLAKDIYINIMVTSALVCIIVLPFIGKLCDAVDPRKLMPIAFLSRCFTTYLFWLLKAPESWETFFVCVSMVVFTISASVCCDTIFMKNINKETRAILQGVFSIAGQIGMLLFSLVGGWMFDNLGPKSPFVAIGTLDFSFTIIFCIFVICCERGSQQSVVAKKADRQLEHDQKSQDKESLSAFRFDEED